MARKKQTTRKSTRKEKVVTTGRVKCPDCQWTMLLTTPQKDQDEVILHYQQVHGLAPVRQVEDSEDEVAKDISSMEVSKPPVANKWTREMVCHIVCQVECDADSCPKVREQYPL